MTKEEFLDIYYPGLRYEDLSEHCKMLQNALWESYDAGIIKDNHIFKTAYHICIPLYNRLKEHEDQIKNDIDELNGKHGTPMFGMETLVRITDLLQDMAFICDTYHKYFEAFNDSTIEMVANMTNEKPTYQENIGKSVELYRNDASCNENEMLILKSDQKPAHKKWFVKVLNSKIPTEKENRDQHLFDSLNRLFDELCSLGCLNPDNEDREIFIYRFSGFNKIYPPEIKIRWKGKNIFLGYIARCLLSDKTNEPKGLGIISSFFLSETEKEINLATAKNYMVGNYEEGKGKNALPPDFIKAIEILRKCGFVNVEFTSSRR